MLNRKNFQLENFDPFTLNKATSILKTAVEILEIAPEDELIIKIACALDNHKYKLTLNTIFSSFCNQENVKKILDVYEHLPSRESLEKIYYFRNHPSQELSLETLEKILRSPHCRLNVIDLFENNLNEKGIKLLSGALETNQTLTHLELDRTEMNEERMLELATALPRSNITFLNVGNNRLNTLGAKYLADILAISKIEHLKIYSNNIGISGIKHLSRALALRCLKSLNIFGNNLSDEGIKHLAETLRNLGENNQLSNLSIGSNNISSTGALDISKSYSETNLMLRIDFSCNDLRNNMYFLDYLPSSLTLLNVKKIGINNNKIRFLVSAIKKFKNLLVLDIEGNSIGDGGISALIQSLPTTITNLSLNGTGINQNGMLALNSLMLKSNLSALKLANNDLDNNALLILTQNTPAPSELVSFNISYNKLTDEIIPQLLYWLEPCKYQIFFRFESNSFSDTEQFKIFDNGELEVSEWNIFEQELTSENIQRLSIMLPLNQQIISLILYNNNIGSSEIALLANVISMTNISKITINKNKLTSDAAYPLLEKLNQTKIKYLNLSDNELVDQSVKQVCDALKQSSTQLQEVCLRGNKLTEESGRYFSEIMPNEKLLRLDLSQNNLGVIGAKYIGDTLFLSSLVILDMSSNHLSDEGLKNISITLGKCRHLQKIYLNDNNIKDKGIEDFCHGLQQNKSLVVIQLSQNNIDDKSIVILMKYLPETNITRVALYENIYSEKVFNNISEAIYQAKFRERNLLINDSHYSLLINNKKRNLNYMKISPVNTESNNRKFLIFLAAPSCAGKSTFWKLLTLAGLVNDAMRISTENFSDLEGYNEYKKNGIRHPELEPDLYQLHNEKRIRLLSERFIRDKIIFVEVHLNNKEIEQISHLARLAKKNGFWTVILGLSIQPYKLFQNARKVKDNDAISISEMLEELKYFHGFLNSLTFFDYKMLIDFNSDCSKNEKPFLISIKPSNQNELVFHETSWGMSNANKDLDIDKLVNQFSNNTQLMPEEERNEMQMSMPSPLIFLSEILNKKSGFLRKLFRYLIPNNNILEYVDDFSKIQWQRDANELSSSSPMIYVIRHAESEANVLEKNKRSVTTNDHDIGLTKNGYFQAIMLAEYMSYICKIRNRKVNIYYSPTCRTMETMNIILSKISNYRGKVSREECLRERSAGLFHGLTSDSRNELYEMQSRFFEYQKTKNKYDATMPGGESGLDISLRLREFVARCNRSTKTNPSEDVIIITHAKTSMVLRKMLCNDYQLDEWYNAQNNEPSNASVFVVAKMPKPIELTTEDKKEIFENFFHCDTDDRVTNSALRFVSSCLGYLNQSIQRASLRSNVSIENKFKEVLQDFLLLNQTSLENRFSDRPYFFLPNILFSAIRFVEEIMNNSFQTYQNLNYQDLELFNPQLFSIAHQNEMSAFSQAEVINRILSLRLFHQRKNNDYADRLFFANYFASEHEGETQEIRHHAQVARKGLDTNKNQYSIEAQFYHAEEWLNFMLDKNKGELFDKIKEALINSRLERNDTLTIAYPIGEEGSSKNIIPIVFAEIIKKRLSVLISKSEEFSKQTISIITLPIAQKTKTSRSNLNPFEKAIYRSYYSVTKIKGKVLVVDDDATSAASISEMVSACKLNGNTVIGCAVAALIPGCEVLKIHPAVKEALEQALREGYDVNNQNLGPNDPTEIYNNLLKGAGLNDGIDSLTNMMGIFQVAALYESSKAEKIVEHIWNISTQEASGQSFHAICDLFNKDTKLFPILSEIKKDRLSTNSVLDNLLIIANSWKQLQDSWDKQEPVCPRKLMLKFPLKENNGNSDLTDPASSSVFSKKICFFDLGVNDSVFSSPEIKKVVNIKYTNKPAPWLNQTSLSTSGFLGSSTEQGAKQSGINSKRSSPNNLDS